MLHKKVGEYRKQISFVCIEDLVPENHILRDIDKAIDFSFIYDEVKDMYSKEIGSNTPLHNIWKKLCMQICT